MGHLTNLKLKNTFHYRLNWNHSKKRDQSSILKISNLIKLEWSPACFVSTLDDKFNKRLSRLSSFILFNNVVVNKKRNL